MSNVDRRRTDFVTHQAIRLSTQCPRIPPLHVVLLTLPLVERSEVDVNNDVSFSVRSLVRRLASEGTEENERERSRVGDSRQ